ncbi:uncharacterized protein B0T15DRAFT_520560 [Chaetomium strumarium]|uniref:Uncharacterized protein n=1 Tax=Chaetomium strumarium TaxID=1170767 RepID=A0AAJ0H429_9PEZI|nr:hypothetical protein B0T15DRAFT_520560 [Chaetomium strumarium]
MCFHKRLLFGCSHYEWLSLTRACELEESYNRGEVQVGCSVRWSHGFDTVRVDEKCPKCAERDASDNYRLGVLKEQIKVLKEHLMLVNGVSETKEDYLDVEQDPTLPGTDEGGVPSSPVKTDDSASTSLQKNEMYVSGKCMASTVPESMRQSWKRQWMEKGRVDVANRSG